MKKPKYSVETEELIRQKEKEAQDLLVAEYPLMFLEMNRAQKRIDALRNAKGVRPRRLLFEAGNKIGKCLTFQTLIDTPDGEIEIGTLFKDGKPFKVYAWDGEKKIVTDALPPRKKPGVHECYRIEMANGCWFEAADRHYVLTSVGWLQVRSLYEYFQDLQESTSEPCLSILPSGAVNLSEKLSGYRGGYSGDHRQYGEQLREAQDTFLTCLPLPDDVPQPSFFWSCGDGRGSIYTNIFRPIFSRLSSWYDRLQTSVLSFGSLFRSVCISVPRLKRLFREYLQPSFAVAYQLQPFGVSYRQLPEENDSDLRLAYERPPIVKCSIPAFNQIISCKRITSQEVYDFEVPKYHNYYAGGMVHHNTQWGLGEDLAHAFGFRPWLLPEHPDHKIDIPVPNNGMIGCETMMHSVPEKIEPVLRRLIPKHCEPVFRLNPQGVVKTVTLTRDPLGNKCGSVIHIRSYDQRPDTFEGIDFDWIHWDEPPPKDIFQAAERGKVVTNAPSWFTMTPLKEPYIYDQFSLKSYSNGGDDDEIGVVRGAIWDNCRDYCKPCDLRIAENETERVIRKCPKCGEVMGFIPYAGILEYLKNLDPEEREAREFGKWHHLSGLVYKEIDRNAHVYEDFMIPKNWMKIEAVDPHDARPVHWLFGAVSPEEIEIFGKKRHRIYWYDYCLATGDLDDVVRQVKSKRALHGYDTPYFVVLDKKFGEKTQMEERSWQTELERRGITRMRLSHSSPGDVELGHKLVREYIKPQFSTLLGTAKPGMLWAKRECCGSGSPFHAMCNYQYKENKDKPEEEYKDWCDCVRYAAMEQPTYKAPEDDRKVVDLISKRNSDSMKSRRMNFASA